MTTWQERHDQWMRFDARLVRLRAEHPILFNLLAAVGALGGLVAVLALEFLINRCP